MAIINGKGTWGVRALVPSGAVITSGLVLYLDAAKPSSYVSGSTTWTDISSGGNSTTLVNGPTFNNLKGGSITFDGVDDRVSKTSNINTGQNFTVSAWIYPTLLGSTRRCIIANGYNYSYKNGWAFLTSGFGVSNTLYLSIGSDSAYKVAPANTLTLNTWTHITGVVAGGGSSINLYKNGVVLPTYSYASLATNTITYDYPQFNLGYRAVGGTTDPYTGNIAQTLLYNRALTDAEVLQNYNATKTTFL